MLHECVLHVHLRINKQKASASLVHALKAWGNLLCPIGICNTKLIYIV